jgi:hypothetical protein
MRCIIQDIKRLSLFIIKLCFLVEFTALAVAANAAETTWNRGASTSDWTNSLNWSHGAPTAGANAVFAGNVGGDPNQLTVLSMDKITFAAGTSAGHSVIFQDWNVNAAGRFLEVQAGNSGNQCGCNAARADSMLVVDGSGNTTIAGRGSSGGQFQLADHSGGRLSVTKLGNGTLILGGNNTPNRLQRFHRSPGKSPRSHRLGGVPRDK